MKEIPSIIISYREMNKGCDFRVLTNKYYDILNQLHKANREKSGKNIYKLSIEGLRYLEPLIVSTKKEFGSFDIIEIPVIEFAAKLAAILQDTSNLSIVKDIVWHFKELSPWKDTVEEAFELMVLSEYAKEYIHKNPQCIQSSLIKSLFGDNAELGREAMRFMEMLGIINRKKEGNFYRLELMGKIINENPNNNG